MVETHVVELQKWFIGPGKKLYYCSCGASIRAWTVKEAREIHNRDIKTK